MRDQPSDDDIRRVVLEARQQWPLAKERHIGVWENGPDGKLCRCDSCGQILCGIKSTRWHADLADPNAKFYLWHMDEVHAHPSAFADEPLCAGCLRGLATRIATRTPEELLASEWNAPGGNALTWTPPHFRGGRPKTRTMEWTAIRRTWPTLGATRPGSHERA